MPQHIPDKDDEVVVEVHVEKGPIPKDGQLRRLGPRRVYQDGEGRGYYDETLFVILADQTSGFQDWESIVDRQTTSVGKPGNYGFS